MVKIWNASLWSDQVYKTNATHTQSALHAWKAHDYNVSAIAFSSKGILASGDASGEIRLWNAETAEPVGHPLQEHADAVSALSFSQDGTILASGSGTNDRRVIIWNVANFSRIGTPLVGHTGEITAVSFSPDGHLLASGGTDHAIVFWNVQTHERVGNSFRLSDSPSSLAFNKQSTVLYAGLTDGSVMAWDLNVTHWAEMLRRIANRELSPDEFR
jgi:WD40 repeat protein